MGSTYCHAGCGTRISRNESVQCRVCGNWFCQNCTNADVPISVCDDCIVSAVEDAAEAKKPARQAKHTKALSAAKKRLQRIEKLKGEIAAKRDLLRKEVSSVEDICETLDRGCDDITGGLRQLTDGIDTCSELL